jgi:hypothetical protein
MMLAAPELAERQALNTPPRPDQRLCVGQCAEEMVTVMAYMREAMGASAPYSDRNRDGQGLRMRKPFERTYNLVDHIAKALFDALGQWLRRTFLVFTHALRLEFSMGPRVGESTVWRRFGNSRTGMSVCV